MAVRIQFKDRVIKNSAAVDQFNQYYQYYCPLYNSMRDKVHGVTIIVPDRTGICFR